MIKINKNFLKLQDSYLFSTINQKVNGYIAQNPSAEIIKLGIGDVTRPIPQVILDAIKKATDEMGNVETFKGYGPEHGYDFLREKIVENEYSELGIDVDEIFVSDGAKCDTGNIVEIFDENIKIAITDPVYPVYLDTNVMYGRTGEFNSQTGMYDGVIYMKANEENNFEPKPEESEEIPDLIYICSPNNPTGTAMTKETLKKWVDFAKEHNSIILYDAAYEAFIEEKNIPHSIYEIEGAKEVAIEFKSFSKTAGFTGLRCAYTVVPKECEVTYYSNCEKNIKYLEEEKSENKKCKCSMKEKRERVSLNKLWKRRSSTKFNGVSYIIQRGAEATYTKEGKEQIKKNIEYYKENARIIRHGLKEVGITAYGGINAPYVWLKTPKNMKSWELFDLLLEKYNIVGTPGVGFGPSGEGYFRLTAFGDREKTIEAVGRLRHQNKMSQNGLSLK